MPSVHSVNPVSSIDLLDALLSKIGTGPTTPTLTSLDVNLFTAGPIPIVPTSVSADFTHAAFDGYAPIAVTVFPVVNPPANNGRSIPLNAFFQVIPPNATPQTVLGYWVADSGSGDFYFGEYFPVPITMTTIGDYIDLLCLLSLAFQPRPA